jgi:hypothetical protein
MALKTATRTAQWPMTAHFVFNFDDTMVPVAGGAAVDFGESNTAETVVEIVPLPPGAVVTGGYIARTTAFDAATFNVEIGDADDPNRYLTETDVKGVGKTDLVPTGYVGAGQNIQLTFTAADACTTGTAIVVVEYIIDGRSNEVQVA